MNKNEGVIRYDDIERHETTFKKHPTKGKKKRVRRMKLVEIKPKNDE